MRSAGTAGNLVVPRRDPVPESVAVDHRGPAFRLGHRPELDGLRGIAALMVVIYHTSTLWPSADRWLLPGGFLGVDVFLVLSGFLITAILHAEYQRTNAIDLVAFLRRRLLRLVPAIVAILAVMLAIAATDRWYAATQVYDVRDVLSAGAWSLTFATNWAILFGYGVGPLGHLWTVALEGQFYLVWGLSLAAVTRRARQPLNAALSIAVAGIIAASCWRWITYEAGIGSPFAPYMGTLTRLDAPLVGAVAGLLVASGRVRAEHRRAATVAGAAGLALVLVGAMVLHPFDAALYRGGFLLLALCSAAAVVGATLAGEGVPARVLRARPLVSVGLISYSLYLWHLPVFQLLQQKTPGWQPAVRTLVGLTLSLGLATASYGFVERPFIRRSHRRRIRSRDPAVIAA